MLATGLLLAACQGVASSGADGEAYVVIGARSVPDGIDLCNDYGSRTNYAGTPYYVVDPEDGRIVRRHQGMDFCAPAGTKVIASADGVITDIVWDNRIRGGSVTMRTFATHKRQDPQAQSRVVLVRALHIDPDPNLRLGQVVGAGTVIGKVQPGGKEHIGPRSHVHFSAGDCGEVWICHTDPNEFWADGPGKVSCFDAKSPPPRDKMVAPLACGD